MKTFLTLLFIIPLLSLAQDKGIAFEHNSTWEKVKEKAKAENKHIFVDCFTTWCGPCKYMSSTIFPQEKVGDFFNANFVNLKIQMDETNGDSEEVKAWYEEAKRFATNYKVVAYPTFLIFNPDGELVHRIIGGGEADPFIARAKEGLNPETQYVTIVKKFEASPNDAEIAKKTAEVAKATYDNNLTQKATDRYISLVGAENLLTSEGVEFLLSGASSSTSTSYKVIKDNKAKVEELLGDRKARVNNTFASVLTKELVSPVLKDKSKPVDFEALKQHIEKEHPYVDMSASINRSKLQYYFTEKNWPAFKDAVNEHLANNGQPVAPASLNNFAWTIFENCDDPACLQAALAWSKQSFEGNDNPMYLDTYANLLYKSGDKDNAIKWQEKAVEKAPEADKENYIATLDKMKKGTPTWE